MTYVSSAVEKMIRFYEAESKVRLHDINHFMKVWGFARTIGLAEGLDDKTQLTLELAVIVHDIACPLCRRKYGNTDGKLQEMEGKPLAEAFYSEFDLPKAQVSRIGYLVAHHHTYTGVDGMDWQVLLEADFLVNADESAMTRDAIVTFRDRVYRTKTGRNLLERMYLSEN